MENLVGRKVKCITSRWSDLTLNKVYEINKETNFNFYITNDDLFQDEFSKHHIGNSSFELLPNEPQFKQGDKVLVSNDRQKWHERIFVVEHNNLYQCEPLHENISNALTPWQHIKPYEEGIKVGDWVKRISDETIWKIRDKEDVNVALNSECTKITNPQLIELLNKELK